MLKNIFDLKKTLADLGKSGLALDIDDTLAWSALNYFKWGVSKFKVGDFTAEELMAKYRYTFSVPEWQNEQIHEYFEGLRRDNDFHLDIPLFKDADKGIQEIHKIKPIVCYITARPIEVQKATRAWLAKYKFPEVPIIYKPDFIAYDLNTMFKAELLQFLYPEVRGLIDDNPRVLDYLPNDYPGMIYVYDFNKDGLKPKHPRSRVADNWKDMVRLIQRHL